MNVEPRWKQPHDNKRRKKRTEFAKARAEVAERSNGRCEAQIGGGCLGQGTQAHHKRRRSQGGKDTAENLLWVCLPCHGYIHAHPAESVEAGWLTRSSFDPAPGLINVEKVAK